MADAERHTHIGGQAVLEGIMMRGKYNWAIAVRCPDGTLYIEEHDLVSAATTRPWLRLPIVRGIWGFYETLVLAMRAFSISAEHAGASEGEDGEHVTLSATEIAVTLVIGIALAIGVFVILPAVLTNLLGDAVKKSTYAWNVIDGVLRLVVFFAYIWVISRLKDIQRVFAYHGAEHKTIHAYEHGEPLDPEHVQKYGTLHVRCGTAFLLMVMVIAIVVFSLVPAHTLLTRILSRLVLAPLIAGIAYEVTVKWAGSRPNDPFVKAVLWPGMQLQRMTTRPPEDEMIEVAVAAMLPVIAREEAEDARAAAAEPV
ncbi:MAG: DUF1385 domain-containing protein [Coriobacteriia bacterium]